MREHPDVRSARVAVLTAGVGVALLGEWYRYAFQQPTKWFPDLVVGLVLIGAGLFGWHGAPASASARC